MTINPEKKYINTRDMKSSDSIEIKPYNLKQLAAFYGVCCKTMNKWMAPFSKEIGTKQGQLYTKKQVELIFNCLGHPGN